MPGCLELSVDSDQQFPQMERSLQNMCWYDLPTFFVLTELLRVANFSYFFAFRQNKKSQSDLCKHNLPSFFLTELLRYDRNFQNLSVTESDFRYIIKE